MWSVQQQDYERLIMLGKYKEVKDLISQSADLSPYVHFLLAYVHLLIGDEKAAFSQVRFSFEKNDYASLDNLVKAKILQGLIFEQLGRQDDLSEVIQAIQDERHLLSDLLREEVSAYWLLLNGLLHLGKYDTKKATDYLNQALDVSKNVSNPRLRAAIMHAMGLTYRNAGNLKKAHKYYQRALDIKQSLDDPNDIALTIMHMGNLYGSKGDMERALSYFHQIIDMEEQLDNEMVPAKVLNNLGVVDEIRGDIQGAINKYTRSIDISRDINLHKNMVNSYINLGNIYKQQSNYDKALYCYRNAMRYTSLYDDEPKKAVIYTAIGLLHKSLGQLKQAEYYYLRSLEISTTLNDKKTKAVTLNNLGVLSNLLGNIDKAETYFLQALEIQKERDDIVEQGSIISNLGLIAQKKFQYDKARDYYNKSYKIRKQFGNEIEMSSVLFHLIQLETDIDNTKDAQRYFNELSKIAKSSTINLVRSRVKIAEAIMLKSSSGDHGSLRAHELIEDVLSGDYVDFELNVFAMINLCDYLIHELKATNSPQILEELESTLNTLYEIATENESHDLIAKTLMIQANLALLKLDTGEAVYLLQQAHDIAENHNLEDVSLRISYLETQVQSNLYDLAVDEPIGERVDQLEIEEYIKNLFYQKQTAEILKQDIDNIRRFNIELANLIQFEERVPNSMQNLAKIVELSGREMHISYSTLSLLQQIEQKDYDVQEDQFGFSLILEDLLLIYKTGFDKNNLSIEVDDKVHDLVLTTDSLLLERVLDNIFLNLIKFSSKGSQISISTHSNETGVHLVFDNDCQPVPAHELPMLFEKYHQYSANDRIVKGYGVGLSFCRAAMTEMGKQIQIWSPIPGAEWGFRTALQL